MSRNIKTPRTLSEAVFVTGYQSASIKVSRMADWILASTIGALLAVALVSWWSS